MSNTFICTDMALGTSPYTLARALSDQLTENYLLLEAVEKLIGETNPTAAEIVRMVRERIRDSEAEEALLNSLSPPSGTTH